MEKLVEIMITIMIMTTIIITTMIMKIVMIMTKQIKWLMNPPTPFLSTMKPSNS